MTPAVKPEPANGAVPLLSVQSGQEVELIRMDGGREFQHRMAEMGLRPGARFRVLNRSRPGPFLICLKDARLMLGRGMVSRVLVRLV